MGVVAYEISKRNPSSIHGFDKSREHINIARAIFLAVPIESRFECMDLGGRQFVGALKPSYDIVLALAVYHHLRKTSVERAQAAMHEVAARCASTIILRDPGHTEHEVISLLGARGFRPIAHSEKPARIGRLTVLSREQRVHGRSP
jgi:hypothetical protein